MKSEKTFNLIGIILGIVIIGIGIYIMTNPAESYSTSSVLSYTFGADFYTEQYQATRAAAQNAATTAANLRNLSEKLAQYAGFAFIFAGALVCLDYSKKYVCCMAMPEKPKETIGEIDVIENTSSAESNE